MKLSKEVREVYWKWKWPDIIRPPKPIIFENAANKVLKFALLELEKKLMGKE